MALPKCFCWTRFGTEAGEAVDQILGRKEKERHANGGVFLWGIGNALAPSMRRLVALEPLPEIIFSPIRSSPRREDINPEIIVRWTTARTMDGHRYPLPSGSIVTSRAGNNGNPARHYALVCFSDAALRLDAVGETLGFETLRNLLTGRPVGASQVTAVVRQTGECSDTPGKCYKAALRARLVYPYFVELTDPIPQSMKLAHGRVPAARSASDEAA
jgi:hypothetical protein